MIPKGLVQDFFFIYRAFVIMISVQDFRDQLNQVHQRVKLEAVPKTVSVAKSQVQDKNLAKAKS